MRGLKSVALTNAPDGLRYPCTMGSLQLLFHPRVFAPVES